MCAKSGGTQHSKSGPPSPQSSGTAFFEKAAFPFAVRRQFIPPLRGNAAVSPQDHMYNPSAWSALHTMDI